MDTTGVVFKRKTVMPLQIYADSEFSRLLCHICSHSIFFWLILTHRRSEEEGKGNFLLKYRLVSHMWDFHFALSLLQTVAYSITCHLTVPVFSCSALVGETWWQYPWTSLWGSFNQIDTSCGNKARIYTPLIIQNQLLNQHLKLRPGYREERK